ncbi:hypothetical protein ACWDYH_31570 [Nocardia goodfellowii]
MSETLGQLGPGGVSVIVDGALVSVKVVVSVVNGSPLIGSSGAESVIVTVDGPNGSTSSPVKPGSSPGNGTSLGVTETELDSLDSSGVVSAKSSVNNPDRSSKLCVPDTSEESEASLTSPAVPDSALATHTPTTPITTAAATAA